MSESIWPQVQAAFNAFGPHYQEQVMTALADIGFEGHDWFVTYLAYGVDPDPLTAVAVQKLLPYGNAEARQVWLAQPADHGFIAAADDYEYTLTEKGRSSIETFFKVARIAIGAVKPMPTEDMDRLAALLQQVIETTLADPELPVKPHLQISRRTAPSAHDNAAVQIDQYLTDLLRYRDDAHIAAWSPHHISGHTWEAFTLIWQETVQTLAELVESRQQRRFDTAAYADALSDLIQRGWVMESEGIYQVTDTGKQLREAAEAKTEDYFNKGLAALSSTEVEELRSLLQKLKEGLTLVETNPT